MNFKKNLGPRVNEYIRTETVQLVDEKGENLGNIPTTEAILKAKEVGLDLVEVGASTTPPVCKIMDFSKYIYNQSKKNRANKRTKTKEQKEFRFSPVIEKADIDHRVKRSKEFLTKGHQVRIVMQKKGRQSMDQAKEVFTDILTNFADYSSIESEPKYEGNRISMTFKPNGKTENK
jgi:translation initiation factor IF-3